MILLVCFLGEILAEVFSFPSIRFDLIFKKIPCRDLRNMDGGHGLSGRARKKGVKINKWSKNV